MENELSILNKFNIIDIPELDDMLDYPDPEHYIYVEIDVNDIERLIMYMKPKGWKLSVRMGDSFMMIPETDLFESEEVVFKDLCNVADFYKIRDIMYPYKLIK